MMKERLCRPYEDEQTPSLSQPIKAQQRWRCQQATKLKVTAADVSNTIARALINPRSSALFIHEQIAQHLRLPHTNKNAGEQRVAGTCIRFCIFPGVWCWGWCGENWDRSVCAKEDNQGFTPALYSTCPQLGPLVTLEVRWFCLQNSCMHWFAAAGWSIHQHTSWWPVDWTLKQTIHN